MFKGSKPKDSPAPICWLFLGGQQNIGGFTSIPNAMNEVWGYHYTNARIYGDAAGEMLLWVQQNETERMDCGCVYEHLVWHNPVTGERQKRQATVIAVGAFCERPMISGFINHKGSITGARHRMEIRNLPQWMVSGSWDPQDNGDPLR